MKNLWNQNIANVYIKKYAKKKISKDLALTYAIISHASNYIPYIIVGSIYFLKSGIKISSVKKGLSNNE